VTQRIIAIGDIHGCSRALAALLDAIKPGPGDTIVTLGDYIDRGPDSRGVIEHLLHLQKRCQLIPLMGNHEEMFLAARQGQSDFQFWLKFGGQEFLDSYSKNAVLDAIPRTHVDFIKMCKRFHESETHLFVHANYWPNRPLDQVPTRTLFWENLDVAKAFPHYSGKTMVVGHTPQTSGEILDLGYLVAIDTFCHGGGWLTALDTTIGHYWQANEQGTGREGHFDARKSNLQGANLV
jgi:serine/threonine protein phosphatase 1